MLGLVVLGVVLWKLLPLGGATPSLDDPVAVAEFINSGAFKALPSDARRPYTKAARKHQKGIEEARRAGRIDGRTYRAAHLASWIERRVDDMEEYYARPVAKRRAELDEMLLDKPTRPAGGTSAKTAAPSPPGGSKESDTSLLYEDEADEAQFEAMKDRFEDDFLDNWPPQRKEQYKQFRRAYTERRKELEAGAPASPPARAAG